MEPITLLLVDDQDIILDGLQAVLEGDERFSVVGRAANGHEAIEMVARSHPDVVLLDINMPGMDGIEAAQLIRRKNHDQRILVITMYNNRDFITELLNVGVRGYLLKNAGREEICEAIIRVSQGLTHLGREVAGAMKHDPGIVRLAGTQGSLPTKREKQIICMIMGDHTTQEIANALELSPSTVETHRKNILSKLGVHNAAGLVRYGLERGWQAA